MGRERGMVERLCLTGGRFSGNSNISNGSMKLRKTEYTTWSETMDTDAAEIFQRFSAPFPKHKIHFRVGATDNKESPKRGIALAYLSAVDVMNRLDEVVGPDNWQDRYPFSGCCELSIRISGDWITKSNCAGETDVEGEKGQASTAFKRAAVKFGIGRSLYEMKNTWYEVQKKGRTAVFTDSAVKKMKDDYERWIRGLQPQQTNDQPQYTKEQYEEFHRLIKDGDPLAYVAFMQTLDPNVQTALYNSFEQGKKVEGKKRADTLNNSGHDLLAKYVDTLSEAAANNDTGGIVETVAELTNDAAKQMVWTRLSAETRAIIKDAMKAA